MWTADKVRALSRTVHVRAIWLSTPVGSPFRKQQGAGAAPRVRHHDLRHYLVSLLIADDADRKVVQARLRHSSAATTLDTYLHLA